MLFNSYIFILIFLPVTLTVFTLLGRKHSLRAALVWLVFASLFFYSWWNPAFLPILLGSILFNYFTGKAINPQISDSSPVKRKTVLVAGITANLCLLGYFKYADFLIATASGEAFSLTKLALPLAISFYTLQQIAYLIDSYKGVVMDRDPVRYALFVSFFPQLIAGPIVHHKEMMPQFGNSNIFDKIHDQVSIGLAIFVIGLFKKVVIADTFALYADPVFAVAESGGELTFVEAWVGALSYSFQLYFDFSGYSDMAIGLANMFGIKLPENFRSPYKATNIISFWRCWHVTLSRFLREYLYIPLGGNKKGEIRQCINLLLVMTIGGVWHGAGFTFMLWGLFHGVALVINHLWQTSLKTAEIQSRVYISTSRLLTLVVIVTGWVLFRAETVDGAMVIIASMFGSDGISLPSFLPSLLNISVSAEILSGWINFNGMFHNLDEITREQLTSYRNMREVIPLLLLAIPLVLIAPNTQTIFKKYEPVLIHSRPVSYAKNVSAISWGSNLHSGMIVGSLFCICLLALSGNSPFLYFQF